MDIIAVNSDNEYIFQNLIQYYEAEFSDITKKQPNAQGRFSLHTYLGPKTSAYLLYVDRKPAGLAAFSISESGYEMHEFYIVPVFRHQSWGIAFAHEIWQRHPGCWQVKQMRGAEYASAFWRKAIKAYDATFEEDQYEDPYWGRVTRQSFEIEKTISA